MTAPVQQSGFVLMTTLWIMIALGVMLTNLAYQVRVESTVARWALNQSMLRWAARGMVHKATATIRDHAVNHHNSPYADGLSIDTLYQKQFIGGAHVSLVHPHSGMTSEFATEDNSTEKSTPYVPSFSAFTDEESKLNINVATSEQLARLSGITVAHADAIVQFRQQLQVQQVNGSANSLADRVHKRHTLTTNELRKPLNIELIQGPFRSLADLLLVEGFTTALLYEEREGEMPLAALLTTTSSGKININSASREVLTAIGLEVSQVNALLDQRMTSPLASIDSLPSSATDTDTLDRIQQLAEYIDVRSTTFRILAQASFPDQKMIRHADATIFVGSSALTFIRWSEY